MIWSLDQYWYRYCVLVSAVPNRVVKRSSDLRTLNFKFEFVFVFQPFDIRIQASLIRRRPQWHRRFCFESGALLLQWCTVCRFLCSVPAVNSSNACRVFTYSSPLPAYRWGIQLLSILHCSQEESFLRYLSRSRSLLTRSASCSCRRRCRSSSRCRRLSSSRFWRSRCIRRSHSRCSC